MSDIINTVKEEILRLADKQAAAQSQQSPAVAAHYRSEAIELRRLVKQQERRSNTSRSSCQSSSPKTPSWRAFAFPPSL